MLRKTLFCAALALAGSGCDMFTDGFPWPDLPSREGDTSVRLVPMRGARPLEVPDTDGSWTLEVDRAARDWAKALAGVGCPAPFAVVRDGGYPVTLVPEAEWPFEDASGMTGPETVYQAGFIDLKEYPDEDTRGRHRVLLHEMGHALGLDHHPSARHGGYDGVMTPSSNADFPVDEEVRQAADMMGCGQ